MLYLLKRESHGITDCLGYDEYHAKVVRAENPTQAREIANEVVGDEGKIWAEERRVTCEEISPVGQAEVILADFNAG